MTHHARRPRHFTPHDMDETKEHIMIAGKEILLAAQGALRFCKDYVEASMPRQSRSNLVTFFHKALMVAEELGHGISGVAELKQKAESVAKPFLSAIEHEMRREKTKSKEKKCVKKRKK